MANRLLERLLRRIILVGGIFWGACFGTQAATPLFENFGTLTNVPQIDTLAFANYGDFTVSTILPYEMQNTLYFTNTGRMLGIPGFRFENVSSASQRSLAASFFNGVDARVRATDAGRFLPGTTLTNFGLGFENSQLVIAATNVVNKGHLLADTRGRVRIEGKKVDLSRSSIGILPFAGGQGLITPTNFIPDVGVFDLNWGMNNAQDANLIPVFGPGTLAAPVARSTNYMVQTPQHAVTNELFPDGFITSLRLTNASGFVMTNAPTPTNWLVQAVFVQTSDTNLVFSVKFTPSTIATNPYKSAIVEFFKLETNVLSGGYFTNLLYVIDRIASETNFIPLTNLTTLTTFRPANYEVTRATPLEFLAGQPANWRTNAAMVIQAQTYSNMMVTNIYSGYGFNVTNLAFAVPPVPGSSLTNLPGRVELIADELDLTRTRVRGEGIVNVSSRSVMNSNAVFDVPNLSFDLKSASGNLVVKGLGKDMIERTTGDIFAWSAVWTNQTGITMPDPNDPTTNIVQVVDIGLHAFVVDATRVKVLQPVITASFTARGTNVVLADTMRIRESILVETESLTLTATGQILLPNSIPNWNRANFPLLLNLTNEGRITLVGSVSMGTDTDADRPYNNIVNRGTITAFNQAYRSGYFENAGAILSERGTFPPGVGTISVQAGSIKLEGGRFEAGGEIRLAGNDLTIRKYAITNRQALTLVVTNSIGDSGQATNNVISTEGFHFVTKPKTGDLLGTKIESVAPRFLAIPHTVAGEDRGPVATGFKDNLAIGRLVLKGDLYSLFAFSPAGSGKRALYVDYLELGDTVKPDIANSLQIDPNLVVYFADANVPVEQLDGLFKDADAPLGRLRWVSEFAGPNSSVDVLKRSENRTVPMNRALRTSTTLDTDGDGIPNNRDANPLDPDTAAGSLFRLTFEKRPTHISISWLAQAGGTYFVEYTSDLGSANWQVFSTFTNTGTAPEAANVEAPIPTNEGQRFYRVRPAR
ncbi:MAG: hypothetical protein HY735_08840 [Verrucomicrobia bacterium]|nr:hypothetical protein [Verrucomicrobiota bacterium]